MMDALYSWWRSVLPKSDPHPEFTSKMLEASRFADEQLEASLQERVNRGRGSNPIESIVRGRPEPKEHRQ